jgi:hypothetical protein
MSKASEPRVHVIPDISAAPDAKAWARRAPGAPLRPPASAEHVASINWADSGPGLSWPEWYWIADSGTDLWVLWRETDTDDAYGDAAPHPVAWCKRLEPQGRAAARLLEAYWRKYRDLVGDNSEVEVGSGGFAHVDKTGVLGQEEIYAIARKVWPLEFAEAKAIARLLRSREPEAFESVLLELKAVTERGGPEARQVVLDQCRRALRSRDEDLRFAVATYLPARGADCRALLKEALNDRCEDVRSAAAQNLERHRRR